MSAAAGTQPARPARSVPEARAQLVRVLDELDERLSVLRSIRRHPVAWTVGGTLVLLGIVGATALVLRGRR